MKRQRISVRGVMLARAQQAIDNDETIIYDVAAEHGQMVDNVKHMLWFLDAVADEIQANSEGR